MNNEIKEYCHITDTHFTSASNVRAGDYCGDLIAKLRAVVDMANSWNATIIHSGDFFDKPTVADFVKTLITTELKRAKHTPIVIYGNHDILFNNRDMDYKTSLQLMIEAGTVEKLTYKDCGSHILTNLPTIVDAGKPQIGLYHGFLNKEDGVNTFLFEQIQTQDPCYILLGHDHVTYNPVQYKNSLIFRNGSFARGIRADESNRIPQAMRIRVKPDGTIHHKMYDIPCKPAELIFKTKKVKADKVNSYDAIIQQIRDVADLDLTFEKAVRLVASNETALYLDSVKYDVESKRDSK